jgi:hypothetical protein
VDPAVWIALIAACAAFVGSIAGPLINARIISRGKVEDWARQDEVAARAETAAANLAEAQAETMRRTDEVADVAAKFDKAVQVKLDHISAQADQIHGLVNSKLSAALENEQAAVVDRVSVMQEIIRLNRAQGLEPSPATLDSIAKAEARVHELRVQLEDRE